MRMCVKPISRRNSSFRNSVMPSVLRAT
jgi:hypothetical protein